MLRHLAASWLFAGFLVVVAVATWRVLDARTPPPPVPPPAPPVITAEIVPVYEPPTPAAPPPSVTSCGGAHDPFDAARAVPQGTMTTVQLGTQPFSDTIIDGKPYGSTPFYGPRRLTLTVGEHEVQFRDKTTDKRYRYRLNINADDPDNKVIIVLSSLSDQPRTTGSVTMTLLDMTEMQAQGVFSDAVDALRDKRNARGCDLLDSIVQRTPSSMRWNEKAANLYSRRCD